MSCTYTDDMSRRAAAIAKLREEQAALIARETGSLFMGLPDRWIDDPHYICPAGHVRTGVIKSGRLGDMCGCGGPMVMTAPERCEAKH